MNAAAQKMTDPEVVSSRGYVSIVTGSVLKSGMHWKCNGGTVTLFVYSHRLSSVIEGEERTECETIYNLEFTNLGCIPPWTREVYAVEEIPQSQLGEVVRGRLLHRNVAC